MRRITVHKYLGDNTSSEMTACGLRIYKSWIPGWKRHVDADKRKVTCGNCQRTSS